MMIELLDKVELIARNKNLRYPLAIAEKISEEETTKIINKMRFPEIKPST